MGDVEDGGEAAGVGGLLEPGENCCETNERTVAAGELLAVCFRAFVEAKSLRGLGVVHRRARDDDGQKRAQYG